MLEATDEASRVGLTPSILCQGSTLAARQMQAAGLAPPPPCTLNASVNDAKAAVQRLEANAARVQAEFTPRINRASAQLRRELPIEDVLIGKGRQAQQKKERAIAGAERAKRVAAARTHCQPTRETNLLAQRYDKRNSQPGVARYMAPIHSQRRHTHSPSSEPPARATQSVQCNGASGFSMLNSNANTEALNADEQHGALSVAKRNAAWAQLRARRLQQLANRHRRAEEQVCTFQPSSEGAEYIAAIGGGTSLDVVARGAVWQEARDRRLEAARQAILHAQDEQIGGSTHGLALYDDTQFGEPNYMIPTASTWRGPPLPWTFEDPCVKQLPEWAAPRAPASPFV